MTNIHLGYELGTGKPVSVPLKNMMVTGQTQEAGKTTTLEAMIARSGLRALAFLTKRGEGAFEGAHKIAPYFREQADWQFVSAILEASRKEKLKFERAWIIRASEGAESLAQVWKNVQREMNEAKSALSRDVYYTLNAYLKIVVPEIGRVRWAKSVELGAGINVMDLTPLSENLQHLVIQSSLDYVLNNLTDTVVVVPEAWKFIPNSRGTPVKLAAEAYIRQGSGLRNFLWLDSQDIAGVEPLILKSVPLWLLGVQRELNEVKRTLNYVPGSRKPKAATVAELGLGQFMACWGTHVYSVYVQPAWMEETEARARAMGLSVAEPASPPARVEMAAPVEERVEERSEEIGETEMAIDEKFFREFVDRTTSAQERMLDLLEGMARGQGVALPPTLPPAALLASQDGAVGPVDEDALYQRFKARLMKESPQLIRLLVKGTEIQVSHEQTVVEADTTNLRGRLLLLVADGFFDTGATGAAAKKELGRRGWPSVEMTVYRLLGGLVKEGILLNEDGKGYTRVEAVKVVRKGK